jgi:uncharacterized protein (TIGR00725 family)
MRVFVAGTWDKVKASGFGDVAVSLGEELARRGYDLGCGPGTGISEFVIQGYRSVRPRGEVVFFLPSRAEMAKVGEDVGTGADRIVETSLDYPMRNIYQVRASDALILLTGGDGTLEEAVVALSDYKIPVAGFRGSGAAIKALELLLPLFPAWAELLKVGDDISELLDHLSKKMSPRGVELQLQ